MGVMLILIAVNIVIVVAVLWLGAQQDEEKHLTPLPEYERKPLPPPSASASPTTAQTALVQDRVRDVQATAQPAAVKAPASADEVVETTAEAEAEVSKPTEIAPAASASEDKPMQQIVDVSEDEVLERAQELLTSGSPVERRMSIERLAGTGDKAVVPKLVTVLMDDPDASVRHTAALGLQQLGWTPENDEQRAAFEAARVRVESSDDS